MPTLNRWFTAEYRRLASEGKAALADSFETLRTAFFKEDVPSVLIGQRRVHYLSDSFGEPAWHLAADYYGILHEMIWKGDLTSGLDRATRAMIVSSRVLQPGAPLEWYLRETLLDAWLSTDGRGYAPAVITAIDEIGDEGLPSDIAARLAIVRACAEALLDPASGAAAYQTLLAIVPTLPWERAYCLRLGALGLTWAGRYDDAAADYEAAMNQFEAMGLRISANDSRLAMGETLIQAGDAGTALEVLRAALSAADRLPNRAHVGMAQGGIGRALMMTGQFAEGYDCLGEALGTLKGLGWLRVEAEIAMARAQAAITAGLADWQADVGDVYRRVERLRSTDLRAKLESLAGS